MSAALLLAAAFAGASYPLMWFLWVRPRLLILREESLQARYRVPSGLVAVYFGIALLAPLSGLVLLSKGLIEGGIEVVRLLKAGAYSSELDTIKGIRDVARRALGNPVSRRLP